MWLACLQIILVVYASHCRHHFLQFNFGEWNDDKIDDRFGKQLEADENKRDCHQKLILLHEFDASDGVKVVMGLEGKNMWAFSIGTYRQMEFWISRVRQISWNLRLLLHINPQLTTA